MSTAGNRPTGPQAVEPYEYPGGENDGFGWEWVERRVRATDDNPTPDATHTFEVTDGEGGLPIRDQPKEIAFGMRGTVSYHASVTVRFGRRVGGTGPYTAIEPRLNPPQGPGQPHTMAQ